MCRKKIEKIVLHIIYLYTSTPSGPVSLHSIELSLFRSALFHGPQKQSSISGGVGQQMLSYLDLIYIFPTGVRLN